MQILDSLKQLRDDIKTWATNNFKALETKIEESTLPIDETLDSTSSNPIQNKAVAEEITSLNSRVGTKPLATQEYVSTAISGIPKPDLTGYATETFVDAAIESTKEEMGQVISSVSKDLQVVDEAGHIVFKVDENGVQTTEITIGGKTLSESLDEKALKNHQHAIKNTSTVSDNGTTVSFEIEGQTFSQEVAIDGGSMSVESAQRLTTGRNIALTGDVVADNVVFDGSSDIVLTTTVKNSEKLDNKAASEYALKTDLPNTSNFITMSDVEAKQYATEASVAEDLVGLTDELKQSILLESTEWQVVDGNNNVIFKVDETGTHTTTLTLNGEAAATKKDISDAIARIDLTDYATEKFVSDAIDAIEFPEPDLSNYVTESTLTTSIKAAKEELNESIEIAKEELSESIVAETDEWQVADNAGNVIFSVDAAGAHTTHLTLQGESLETILDDKASKTHTHQIKNTSHVSTTGTTVAFEIEGQTFSQEVAIDGGSMSVESAQRLTTGRNISLSGDVTAASVVFDGSKDIVLTTTVTNSEKLSNRPASDYALKTDLPDTTDFITMSDVEEKQYLVEADITAKKFVDESSLAAKQYATESFVTDELDGLTEDLKQSILLESKEWQVVDENNNIILKVDADGAHTTAVTINGEVAATESYVNEAVKNVKVDLTDYPTRSEVEDMLPTDYITEEILEAKDFATETYVNTAVEGLAAETYVDSAVEGLASADYVDGAVEGIATELKQSILLESRDWQVVDSDNNVILSVDSDGLHTTSMTLGSESAATEKFVADSIAAIEFPETDLSNYYTKQETEALIPDTSNFLTEIPGEYVTETELTDKGFLTEHQSLDGLATTQELEEHTQNSNLHVTSADKQKWNAKSNFSGDYNDLTNAPAIAEDETGDLVIADNAGNIIFRASDQGLETTHLSIGSLTINGMTIQEIIKAYVDEAILGGEW